MSQDEILDRLGLNMSVTKTKPPGPGDNQSLPLTSEGGTQGPSSGTPAASGGPGGSQGGDTETVSPPGLLGEKEKTPESRPVQSTYVD